VHVSRVSPPLGAAVVLAFASLAPRGARADDVRACIAASTDAQTQRQQGRLLAARDRAIACARDVCPAVVRSQCARWVTELAGRIPAIVVRVQDADGADVLTNVRLSIDGAPARLDGRPVELDPGEHAVEAVTDAGARVARKVLLAESEGPRPLVLRLPPAQDERRERPSPATAAAAGSTPGAEPPGPTVSRAHVPLGAWIAGGIGLAALGGATYFGFAAKGQLDTLDSTCSPHCTGAQTQPGRNDALAFDVLLGAGAAVVGTAIVWALFFPSSSGPPAALDVRPALRWGGGGATASYTLRY
jgi:hypothetical protein